MKVLGISSSPRPNGNSDVLLRRALDGAKSAGAETEYLWLPSFKIGPCVECNSCYKTGQCRFNDDYQVVMQKIFDADRLIFATPIFFMAVCAQAKLLIDRCQCLWAGKYVLKQPVAQLQSRERAAMVIAVGGSKSKKMFECIKLTMKYFFDVLEMKYQTNLFINQLDEKGAAEKHPQYLDEAFRLGSQLVKQSHGQSDKPVDVELTP